MFVLTILFSYWLVQRLMMYQQIVDLLYILLRKIIEVLFVVFFWKIIFKQIYLIQIKILVCGWKYLVCIFDFYLALHLAVQHGHLDVVRRLLSESDIDVFTLNIKYVKLIFLCFMFIIILKRNELSSCFGIV